MGADEAIQRNIHEGVTLCRYGIPVIVFYGSLISLLTKVDNENKNINNVQAYLNGGKMIIKYDYSHISIGIASALTIVTLF